MGHLRIPVFNSVIFSLPGGLAVSWYGVLYVVGGFIVYVFVLFHIKKQQVSLSSEQFMEVLTRSFVGVLVGGRLSFVFFVNPSYYLQNPLKIFAVWEGGMYFFGGFICAALFPWFYIRKQKINFIDLADLAIIPVPLALACGRLGNFINGSFWGKPSTSPLAMIFDVVPERSWFSVSEPWVQEMVDAAALTPVGGLVNLPRHPVQLYELVLEGILLFGILLLFRNVGPAKPRGSVFSFFMLGYGLFRFWIEFYREPMSHSRYIAGDWFTLGMFFCIPMIIGGIVGMVLAYRKNQPNKLYRNG